MEGHIVGLALSPDSRLVNINNIIILSHQDPGAYSGASPPPPESIIYTYDKTIFIIIPVVTRMNPDRMLYVDGLRADAVCVEICTST